MLWALLTTARDEECTVAPVLYSFLTRRDLFSLSKAAKNARCADNRFVVDEDINITELPKVVPFRHRLQLLPGRGWGVICLEEQGVDAGLQVACYSGEAIDSCEAKARRRERPRHQAEFILTNRENFLLEGRSTVLCTHVDATYTGGGIARFFNHSCSPNLSVSLHRHPQSPAVLPVPVFFTTRRVNKFDEMTFDYGGGGGGGGGEEQCSTLLSTTPCRCGAENCRGFLPASNPD